MRNQPNRLQWQSTDNGSFIQGQSNALSSSKEFTDYGKDLLELAQKGTATNVSPEEYFSGEYASKLMESQSNMWNKIEQLQKDKEAIGEEHYKEKQELLDQNERLANSYAKNVSVGDTRASTTLSKQSIQDVTLDNASKALNSALGVNIDLKQVKNSISTGKTKSERAYYLKTMYEELKKEGLDRNTILTVMGHIQGESSYNPINEKQFTYKNVRDLVLTDKTNYTTFRNNLYKLFGTTNITEEMYNAKFKNNPQAYFNTFYGGRMGNTGENEGYLYRGRGLIQITGKDNYRALSKALGVDFLSNPDLLNSREYASKATIQFLKQNGLLKKGISQNEFMRKVFGKADSEKAKQRYKYGQDIDLELKQLGI